MVEKNQKLRIAQFAGSYAPFPVPSDYPNVDASIYMTYDLSKALTQLGHEIICYGPKGSLSKDFKAKIINILPVYNHPLISDLTPTVKSRMSVFFDQYVIDKIFKDHQKIPFDIIHIHKIERALPLAYLFPEIPIVYTQHDPISPWYAEIYRMFASPNQNIVTISDAQRKAVTDLKYYATIYNGVDLNLFPFKDRSKKHLLFAGRLIPSKGAHLAIQVATKINKKLLIAGPIEKEQEKKEYWDKKIKSHLNEQIKYIGFKAHNDLYKYYQQAKVFLMPIMWEEPFGLVVPEANACGTPVVAFARGSMPELIKDGYNGFLVKPGDVKAMAKAVKRIYDMPEEEYRQMRLNCRKHVEDNFTVEKMVDNYEKVYYKIVKESQKRKI